MTRCSGDVMSRWRLFARYLRHRKKLGIITSCLGEILKVYKGRHRAVAAVAAVRFRRDPTKSWRRFSCFLWRRAQLRILAGSLLTYFRALKRQ